MAENLTALASENLNPSLRSLLEDVQRGHIRVPRFQRPFIWQDEQRLELLDSIRMNMPIGSLLVWRTAKFKLATFSNVGPHVIPAIAEQAPATGWQYLLDGHQRVTTLLGLLLQPDAAAGAPAASEEEIDWDIRYDLVDETFVFFRRVGVTHPLLPLWTLLDNRLFHRNMRELRMQAGGRGWKPEDIDTWEERAEPLIYRFQQFRIPIVVMVTESLQQAVNAFHRIKTTGTPVSEAHLLTAITWTPDFDLQERFEELQAAFPLKWRDCEIGIFLKVCRGLAGLDINRDGQTELAKRIHEDKNLLNRAGAGLARAMQWLSDAAEVQGPDLLPYAQQLVLLAVEMDRWVDKLLPERILLSWFWRTAWSGVFAAGSTRHVQGVQAQLQLRAEVDGQKVTIQWTRDDELPTRFDLRLARVRLLILRLALRAQGFTLDGELFDIKNLLMVYGKDVFVRLFQIDRQRPIHERLLVNSLGNRFLVEPGTEVELRKRLTWDRNLKQSVLSYHFMDLDAQKDLQNGEMVSFFRRRMKAINEWDRAEWEKEARAAEDATA